MKTAKSRKKNGYAADFRQKFTCKAFVAGQAKTPARIRLLGEKERPESAQHIIEFPGGALEVSRTSTGDYWAHLIVNRQWEDADCDGRLNSLGEIVGSRITAHDGVREIPARKGITQIALLIRPTRLVKGQP